MQRIWRALSRHENGASRYENKDTRDSWAAKYNFDVGAWHAAQAGLWEMMGQYTVVVVVVEYSVGANWTGSDALVELHEDMVMDRVQDGRDGRLTVTLAKASRVSSSYGRAKLMAGGQARWNGRGSRYLIRHVHYRRYFDGGIS